MPSAKGLLAPLLVVLFWTAAPAAASLFGHSKWTPSTFPDPTQDVERCNRGVPSWICDADGLLSRKSTNVMEGVIKLIFAGESPYVKRECGDAGKQGYEVAVAVMKEMDTGGTEAAVAAKDFAKQLHARWGVGRAECQNGVLILVAIENRQIYISTGKGTMKYLTDKVLDQIIGQSRPFLREKKYDQALEHAVVNTGLALAGKALTPSSDQEEVSPWTIPLFVLFGIACFLVYKSDRKSRQRYAACNTILERIKRDQSALQQGSYAVTSCPICLEDFQLPPPGLAPAAGDGPEGHSAPQPEEPSAPASTAAAEDDAGNEQAAMREPLISRGRQAALARAQGAGGSGSAASAGTASSGDDIEKMKRDGSSGSSAARGLSGVAGHGDGLAEGERGGSGPGRVPLALPCGHLFCEPCLSRWLEQRKTSCPICRADMGGPSDGPSQPPPPPPPGCQPDPQAQRESDFPEPVLDDNARGRTRQQYRRNNWRVHYPLIRPYWSFHRPMNLQAQQRELYRQDLMFRLQALRQRYPEYVTPQMANAWGSDIASGRELSASVLRDFQLRDPAVRAQLESHGSSGMRSGFGGGSSRGGGSSGGGRGGSW